MHATLSTQVLQKAVQLACQAPSVHNSQPWGWVAEGEVPRLFVDRHRTVPGTDRSGREAIISCGAVLDHLRVAMLAAGWDAVIERFPNPNDPDHLASIEFRSVDHVTDAQRDRADAILQRRTDRLPLGRMFHTAPPAIAGWDVRVGCGVVLAGMAFGGTWCPRAPTSGSRSGAFAGCGSPRCRVEVPGFGYAGAAFGLDAVGPGDAEPVAGAAARGEFAGLDPVVDDADAGGDPCGGLGDADLAVRVGVGGRDVVGVADPLHGFDVERCAGAGGEPGGVELVGQFRGRRGGPEPNHHRHGR